MFIKIFCGDSQKYLLLQSDNVVLDKGERYIDYDLYPLICAYIEELSFNNNEKDLSRIDCIFDKYKQIMGLKKKENEADYAIRPLGVLIKEDIVGDKPYCLTIPVLSDQEKREKFLIDDRNDQSMDITNGPNLHKLSIVEVDGKTYITSGPIFIMNDDGKTIDRV